MKVRYLYAVYWFFLIGTVYKICLLLPAIQKGNTVADISIIVNASVAIISAYVIFVLCYLSNVLKKANNSSFDCEIESKNNVTPSFTIGAAA